MINCRSQAIFIILLFLNSSPAMAQEGPARSSFPKNRFSAELLGDPFSIYLERRIFSSDYYALYAGVGSSLLLNLVGESNLAISLNNSYRLDPKTVLFGLIRTQLGSLCFPQVPLGASPGSGYVAGRNHLGINYLSYSFAAGLSFSGNKWEFAPLYPACHYSQGKFNGEGSQVTWYLAISLNSRIYYHF